ncbi:aldose epimerase [Silvibacterium dinghuense]|uniref:Aldose epimerase n=1 Tax=Silvibacterium dinghuense TaxID=1560006 RepID=A0A4Q1SAT9_9BACT|nr:aldose epimerase [Silvibacterium dinghuense]RXS94274.1 aldose epimerase [Silvibacterium dinghuense]GGH17253.1 hypothetical protein GCM10011586_39680 [Silvibacterium dinghuense]
MSQSLELRTEALQVIVAPAEGGRITSVISLDSGLEFLLQPHRPFWPLQPARHNIFLQGACAGIEECLPTVSACNLNGEQIPDHGDFWQMPWEILSVPTKTTLSLCAEGFSRPLRFRKDISLHDSSLSIAYCIKNIGEQATDFLYATHPLLAIDSDSWIVLPQEVSNLTLHSSLHDRLGAPGENVRWPAANPYSQRLDHLAHSIEKTADMLYTGRLNHGWCGLYRTLHRQGLVMRFDTSKLPYIGLWICQGGWPENENTPKQYAFAPEPTTAPCGSLRQAREKDLATPLMPGESFRFTIEFHLSRAGITREEFIRFASKHPTASTAPLISQQSGEL